MLKKNLIRAFLLLILSFTCSCQKGLEMEDELDWIRGGDWIESQLMNLSSVEFPSNSGTCKIKSVTGKNEPVHLAGVVGSDDEYENTYFSESFFDYGTQIQSRVFHVAPWLTIQGRASSPHEDLMDEFTLKVEPNTSGSVRTCRLVFVTFYKMHTVKVVQR